MDICSVPNAVAMLSLALGSVHEQGSSSSLHRVTELGVTKEEIGSLPLVTQSCPHCRMPSALFAFLCPQLLGSHAGTWGQLAHPCVFSPLVAHLYRKVSQVERSPGDSHNVDGICGYPSPKQTVKPSCCLS